jgi:hypothetical protein
LDKGKVIASTSDQLKVPYDDKTLNLRGWIVTLPAHLVVDNGLRIIKGMPWMRTNIRAHVGDLDVSASYPNGGAVCNISKETTHKEIISIKGVEESVMRMEGINLSGGHTNAMEICTALFGMPTLDEMLDAFEESLAIEETPSTHYIEVHAKEMETA